MHGELVIQPERGDGRCVYRCIGDLDGDTAPMLQSAVDTADGQDLVLDFSELAFLDSSAIKSLVAMRKALDEHGAFLRIVGVHGIPARAIELTQLTHYLGAEFQN
jgi:anti-anti-sigma factor